MADYVLHQLTHTDAYDIDEEMAQWGYDYFWERYGARRVFQISFSEGMVYAFDDNEAILSIAVPDGYEYNLLDANCVNLTTAAKQYSGMNVTWFSLKHDEVKK